MWTLIRLIAASHLLFCKRILSSLKFINKAYPKVKVMTTS